MGYKTPQKSHCAQGHPLAGDNLYVSPRGARQCRECNRRWEANRPSRRTGPKPIMRLTLYERWVRFVDVAAGPEVCWPWTSAYTSQGRPVLRYHGRNVYASRVALELKLGRPLGEGMYACHTCDNKACVNPLHIYEGTHADNTRDAMERHRMYRGPRSPEWKAKISAGHQRRKAG